MKHTQRQEQNSLRPTNNPGLNSAPEIQASWSTNEPSCERTVLWGDGPEIGGLKRQVNRCGLLPGGSFLTVSPAQRQTDSPRIHSMCCPWPRLLAILKALSFRGRKIMILKPLQSRDPWTVPTGCLSGLLGPGLVCSSCALRCSGAFTSPPSRTSVSFCVRALRGVGTARTGFKNEKF